MARRYTRRSDALAHKIKKIEKATGEAEVETAAQAAAAAIRPHLIGDRWKADTWIAAAEALGVKVVAYRYKDRAPGFYWGGDVPKIYYNIDDPEILRVLTISHELGHHVVASWPGSRYPRESVERYEGRGTIQHRIARRVEELLLEIKRD